MSRRSLGVAALLSFLAFVLILSSSWNDSPCFDEPEHITAGYTYVGFGYYFMNAFHPPLVKDLAGVAVKKILCPPALKTWWTRDGAMCIEEMFSGRVVDVQTLTRVARMPLIVLASLFVGVFFLAVGQSFGPRVAGLASVMLLLSPTFLAHAGFVHTDVPAAATCFLSLWFLARYLKSKPHLGRALAFALVSGTAVLVKFSCLVLAPVSLIAISCPKDRWARWKHVPLVLAFILAMIYSVYLVHPNSFYRHRAYLEYHFRHTDSGLVGLVYRAAVPPYAPLSRYATGVLVQGRHVRHGHDRPTYLSGRVYYGRQGSFFPTLLLTKLPLGLLCLGLLALWGRPKWEDSELKLYAGFTLLYGLVALSAGINLGIRHLLPMFPTLMVLIASGLDRGLQRAERSNYQRAIAVAFLAILVGNLATWPHYLRYFNSFTLGGIPVVDSNYDWGTDLYRFSERAKARKWDPLYVRYFGGAPPQAYLGERYRRLLFRDLPSRGWVAISESLYIPLVKGDDSSLPPDERAQRQLLREWLEGLEKVETVGTFLVFRIPEPPKKSSTIGPPS